jgi:hypothetical protein
MKNNTGLPTRIPDITMYKLGFLHFMPGSAILSVFYKYLQARRMWQVRHRKCKSEEDIIQNSVDIHIHGSGTILRDAVRSTWLLLTLMTRNSQLI